MIHASPCLDQPSQSMGSYLKLWVRASRHMGPASRSMDQPSPSMESYLKLWVRHVQEWVTHVIVQAGIAMYGQILQCTLHAQASPCMGRHLNAWQGISKYGQASSSMDQACLRAGGQRNAHVHDCAGRYHDAWADIPKV